MPAHRFVIGQSVRLRGRFGLPLDTAEMFRITATLPARDNSPQYRMRNDDERYERVTTEDNLEEVPAPPAMVGVNHKPKKEKLAAKPATPFGSQVKAADNFNSPGKKPKK